MTDSPDPARVGLHATATTCLFDLDGVITKTAVVHSAAWKEMFDDFLSRREGLSEDQARPFDPRNDYDRYVDGKPRYDGVRSFLSSRSISIPDGDPDDAPDVETVCGLGNRKNALVGELIRRDGVEAYAGTVKYLDAARDAGMHIAVVSSSANCRAILESCDLLDYFEEVMDGVVAAERGIAGKPAPDTFLAAAAALGATPPQAVVYEDALAGVQAGRDGKFGLVIGVDRVGQRAELIEHGADVVVDDLEELIK
ncbi:MAG: beta-phosphoglucomutase family hydrolase [Solirubrobacterales bacterium]